VKERLDGKKLRGCLTCSGTYR